jgi:hypothetical protein
MTPQQFRACVDQLRWSQWRLAEGTERFSATRPSRFTVGGPLLT